MRKILASILGIFSGANALWMLAAPLHWFATIPGVTDTGPANAHLIRDVGCAFLVATFALLWFVVNPKRAWPAVLAGAAFLLFHSSIHVWDALAGREHLHRLLAEIFMIILPAFLTLWIGWPQPDVSRKEP